MDVCTVTIRRLTQAHIWLVFVPPNTTAVCQPLVRAYMRPSKAALGRYSAPYVGREIQDHPDDIASITHSIAIFRSFILRKTHDTVAASQHCSLVQHRLQQCRAADVHMCFRSSSKKRNPSPTLPPDGPETEEAHEEDAHPCLERLAPHTERQKRKEFCRHTMSARSKTGSLQGEPSPTTPCTIALAPVPSVSAMVFAVQFSGPHIFGSTFCSACRPGQGSNHGSTVSVSSRKTHKYPGLSLNLFFSRNTDLSQFVEPGNTQISWFDNCS